jgi:hypothetical protein
MQRPELPTEVEQCLRNIGTAEACHPDSVR